MKNIKGDIVLFCNPYNELRKTKLKSERRFLQQYSDNIVCSKNSSSRELLKFNALHENRHYTLENMDANGELVFLDMNECAS